MVRALTSCWRRASRRRIASTRSPGIHTPSTVPAASNRASARVEPVGLRPGRCDPGVLRADDDNASNMRLEDPRDPRRVARDLQHNLIIRREAAREQLQPLRRRLDPPKRADLPGLHDRDLAKVAVNIQPDRSHPDPPRHHRTKREPGGQTTQTDSRSQRTRVSRRGGKENFGPSAHQPMHGLPNLRSPREPLSRSADHKPPTGQRPPSDILMPGKLGQLGQRDWPGIHPAPTATESGGSIASASPTSRVIGARSLAVISTFGDVDICVPVLSVPDVRRQ
jgi:hypothetical protein